MDARLSFNGAMAGNTAAAEDFSDRLNGLRDSAADMGMMRLADKLDRLASEIKAQAAHVDRLYSSMIHEEADASTSAIFSTINAALSRGVP